MFGFLNKLIPNFSIDIFYSFKQNKIMFIEKKNDKKFYYSTNLDIPINNRIVFISGCLFTESIHVALNVFFLYIQKRKEIYRVLIYLKTN